MGTAADPPQVRAHHPIAPTQVAGTRFHTKLQIHLRVSSIPPFSSIHRRGNKATDRLPPILPGKKTLGFEHLATRVVTRNRLFVPCCPSPCTTVARRDPRQIPLPEKRATTFPGHHATPVHLRRLLLAQCRPSLLESTFPVGDHVQVHVRRSRYVHGKGQHGQGIRRDLERTHSHAHQFLGRLTQKPRQKNCGRQKQHFQVIDRSKLQRNSPTHPNAGWVGTRGAGSGTHISRRIRIRHTMGSSPRGTLLRASMARALDGKTRILENNGVQNHRLSHAAFHVEDCRHTPHTAISLSTASHRMLPWLCSPCNTLGAFYRPIPTIRAHMSPNASGTVPSDSLASNKG